MGKRPAASRLWRATKRIQPLRGLIGLFLLAGGVGAKADEYAFSSYGLGGSSFGAGITPPPGTYVTDLSAFYEGKIGTSVEFGGVTLNAGAKVQYFTEGFNLLYVPARKVLGGSLGVSVTVPVGHINIDANLGLGPLQISRSTSGWGLGDIVPRAELGYVNGAFADLLSAGGDADRLPGTRVLADHRLAPTWH
jgi:hypothetical protein